MLLLTSRMTGGSEDIWQIANSISESSQQFYKKQFLSYCHNGISLTLWKIINRRSFIFANFGSMITYVLLFDSSRWTKLILKMQKCDIRLIYDK